MSVTILGVRHHGPGSARAVLAALTALEPDLILIEGPPEAGPLLRHVPGLVPPVAILAHAADRPGEAAFWPFAEFSPEWQAIGYAVAAGREARFIDLPAAVTLAARELSGPSEPAGAVRAGQPRTLAAVRRRRRSRRTPWAGCRRRRATTIRNGGGRTSSSTGSAATRSNCSPPWPRR